MTKTEFLNPLINVTEQQLMLAINDWQNLPNEVLSTQPVAGSWSATECMQHLNFYLDQYLPLLKASLENASANHALNAYKPGWLGKWFTNLMKPNEETGKPNKKMQAPKPSRPKTIQDSHIVVAAFIQNLELLLQLLHRSENLSLDNRIPTTLSSFITLKAGDTFSFLVAHNERHVQQAKRAVVTALKYRPASSSKHPA